MRRRRGHRTCRPRGLGGWRARYDPAPVVSHHHGRKPGGGEFGVRRGDHYGRGAYYTKFLLNRRSRRVYLRGLDGRFAAGRVRLRDSAYAALAGGGRYLVQRFLRGEPIPRFDAAAELTDPKGIP